MKRRDLMLVGLWTLASAGLTVAMFWPANLEALDKTAKPLVAQPTLTAGNAELTVEWTGGKGKSEGQTVLAVGAAPALHLIARNTSADTTMVTWALSVDKNVPPPPESRSLSVPKEMWKDTGSIVLAGHESKTIELKPVAKLEKDSTGRVLVTVGKQSLWAGNYTTTVPAMEVSGALASAKAGK